MIFDYGDSINHIYFIQSGVVSIEICYDRKVHQFDILGRGSILGQFGILQRHNRWNYRCVVKSQESVRILKVSRA